MRKIDKDGNAIPVEKPAPRRQFLVGDFMPATDRLLLLRLPPPPEGAIIKPQIAQEQSEYGFVIAVGNDVEVPVGLVAKFSKFSGPEDIVFDDAEDGDEFVLVYKQDIRGWFKSPFPRTDANAIN